MKYKFVIAPEFKKEFKALSKKYRSLKNDLLSLKEEIKENTNLGVSLGEGLRKIRMNITSKSKGKSGGARVITHELIFDIDTKEETKSIAFISIYDKSEYDTADISVIKEIVKQIREESK